MRYFVLFGILGLVGCAAVPEREQAMKLWKSPDSTLQQRQEAVGKLIPVGMAESDVISTLGPNGRFGHFSGDSHSPDSNTGISAAPPIRVEDWELEYQEPGGAIVIFFQKDRSDAYKYVNVVMRQFIKVPPVRAK